MTPVYRCVGKCGYTTEPNRCPTGNSHHVCSGLFLISADDQTLVVHYEQPTLSVSNDRLVLAPWVLVETAASLEAYGRGEIAEVAV